MDCGVKAVVAAAAATVLGHWLAPGASHASRSLFTMRSARPAGLGLAATSHRLHSSTTPPAAAPAIGSDAAGTAIGKRSVRNDRTQVKRPSSIVPANLGAGWAWEWWSSLGSPKWICSPMVDQSERAFRMLCRRYGVGLAYTPMIHAEPFAVDDDYRRTYFDGWEAADYGGSKDADRPLIAQLGGDDPQTMLRAARLLEPYVDGIDINFGCPTEDARKGGHNSHSPRCRRFGAYLLPSLPLVKRLVRTLADGLHRVPVTAKIRLLDSDAATLEVALAIEEAGAAALCVHGRTAKQRPKYADRDPSGSAGLAPSWEQIAMIRQAVKIPVIANGGIETRSDALRCLEETGAAAVMSAEALLEDPDLFDESRGSLESVDADIPDSTQLAVGRMMRLAREFVDLSETFPSRLKYPPVKSHLFKILHRLVGADQAEARRSVDAGLPLDLQQEMKLALMVCKVSDLSAIRAALDNIEARYLEPGQVLGPSWYRRWRSLDTAPKDATNLRLSGSGRNPASRERTRSRP